MASTPVTSAAVQLEREGASPGAVIALIRMVVDIDVRAVLPSISVPTLILHRDRDAIAPIEGARYMAGRIPGAQLVELEGEHSPLTGDTDTILDHIEEFVTGRRGERQPDRVLATVMFTDIVDSTVQAAALGDRRWSELLAGHHQLVRQQLRRFRRRGDKDNRRRLPRYLDGPARGIRSALRRRGETQNGCQPQSRAPHGRVRAPRDGDISGIAPVRHPGARLVALAAAGEVLVSRTVKDLVAGSGLPLRGPRRPPLKGVPDQWQLYRGHRIVATPRRCRRGRALEFGFEHAAGARQLPRRVPPMRAKLR